MTGDIMPRTRDWRVTLITPEAAGPPTLQIAGEIELGNTNEHPRLSLSEPASPDPSVLVLDLKIVIDGPSELAMHWAAVEFRHPGPEATLKTVRLLWMGLEVATLTVTD